MTTSEDQIWVPEACTLPTVERPLRLAEFDDLFATALRGQHRLSPHRAGLGPRSGGRDHGPGTGRPGDRLLRVDVEVPAAHVAVLDALARRAAAGIRS